MGSRLLASCSRLIAGARCGPRDISDQQVAFAVRRYGLGFPPPLGGVPPDGAGVDGAGADAPGVLMSIFVVLVRCIPPPNTNHPITAKRIRTTRPHTHPAPDPVAGVC
jgi:hypothetical protein